MTPREETPPRPRGRRLFLGCLVAVGSVCLVLVLVYRALDEPRPKGTPSEAADALARKMLNAIDDSAWQETAAVTWRSPRGRVFVWDRARHWVEMRDGALRVQLAIDARRGLAWWGEEAAAASEMPALLDRAYRAWANDSFWLCAPNKVFDPGTTRSIVEREGRSALLVEYSSGGVTPGDAYLWSLHDSGLPTGWEMWVSILPVGGVWVSWDGWEPLSTGARIARKHVVQGGVVSLDLTDVRGARSIGELDEGGDPFGPLEEHMREALDTKGIETRADSDEGATEADGGEGE